MQPGPHFHPSRVTRNHIELSAIAGGQQHHFIDARNLYQARESLAYLVTRENDLFANFDRCRGMVQPEDLQTHKR